MVLWVHHRSTRDWWSQCQGTWRSRGLLPSLLCFTALTQTRGLMLVQIPRQRRRLPELHTSKTMPVSPLPSTPSLPPDTEALPTPKHKLHHLRFGIFSVVYEEVNQNVSSMRRALPIFDRVRDDGSDAWYLLRDMYRLAPLPIIAYLLNCIFSSVASSLYLYFSCSIFFGVRSPIIFPPGLGSTEKS